jgi:alpha-galactosidase
MRLFSLRFHLLAGLLLLASAVAAQAAPKQAPIVISTARTALTFVVTADGRLVQVGYGPRTASAPAPEKPAAEDDAYPTGGNGFINEPALAVVHADGNTSTDLAFVEQKKVAAPAGVQHTVVRLKDRFYPLEVALHFEAFTDEDVIRQWAEIRNDEPGAVTLSRFASTALVFPTGAYYLTQFAGNYMREAELFEERLGPGIKVLDSKIGVRAHQMRTPAFLIAADGPAAEESGQVWGGTLAWSGSFQLAFEVDHSGRLRALSGINPFAAAYRLPPGKTFVTPRALWSASAAGKGPISRNVHRWARRFGIRDGARPRPILLNNWEATHFDFDEAKIVSLFDGARELGAELFLLDDGWFGNKHPRNDDKAGLGDWEVNSTKLPRGLSYLADEAKKRSLGFGIWLEPEMVNPASVLFAQHPDWVITQAHRAPLLSRTQMVLDLTRPEVKEHAFAVIDKTLAPNPGISYVKWDANRYVTQPGSSFLPPEAQQHLLTDYGWALYDVMARMAKKYPQVMAMLCAGGGGRVDYGALAHFHSFWPSDNTDPVQRIFIQWGFGHFFPANTIAAHVTDMGKKPTKLAVDVALTGAFGVDRDVQKMTAAEKQAVAAGAKLYRETLRPLVANGDLYRLESPYDHPRASLSYVAPDRSAAVLFAFQLRETAAQGPVRLRGLDPRKRYRIREVNLPEGGKSRLELADHVVDGATLMERGLALPLRRPLESAVLLLQP